MSTLFLFGDPSFVDVDVPSEPESGVRLVAPVAYVVCLVLDGDGKELARLPAEEATSFMNKTPGAACVVREHDRALLASRSFIPAPTVAAWLVKLGWMHKS